MKIINKPEKFKTAFVINAFKKKKDSILIVPTYKEKIDLIASYDLKKLELDERIFSFSEIISQKHKFKRTSKVYIDNADCILQNLFDAPIDTMTTSCDKIEQ